MVELLQPAESGQRNADISVRADVSVDLEESEAKAKDSGVSEDWSFEDGDKGCIGSYMKLCNLILLSMILQLEYGVNEDH